jgi:DICT domain-containing protein
VEQDETGLTIGDVATRTGLTVPTLRAWEQRYGFPVPSRSTSGHRRYQQRDVQALEQLLRDREAGLSLAAAMTRARTAAVATAPTVFAGLRDRHPELVRHVLGKRAMFVVSRAIEDECLAAGRAALLVGSFQHERFYRQSEGRWRDLARTASTAIAMADFPAERRRAGRPIELSLPPTSAVMREWSVVCDGSSASAVLAGWERPGKARVADRRRRFEAIWSTDAAVVREASEIVLAIAASHSARPLPMTVDQLPPVHDDPSATARRTTAIANRIVAALA